MGFYQIICSLMWGGGNNHDVRKDTIHVVYHEDAQQIKGLELLCQSSMQKTLSLQDGRREYISPRKYIYMIGDTQSLS